MPERRQSRGRRRRGLTAIVLAPGTKLGPYEIVALLGAGGMGEVYRARDTRLGREVAIKVAHQQFDERFAREAQTIAALNHPNLCSLFDVGPNYLVMELLEGETLRHRLSTGGGLGLRKSVETGAQIARGLAAAHEKGIVHRDLKPENIFLCGDGRVKILDFGLAKLTTEALADAPTVAGGAAATAAGMVLGTYGYMAPEQVRGQATDARSDIFAFGAVLYEMLTGRRAFGGDSAADVMSAILKEEPPELTAPAVLPLEPVVRHCLEKEPRQRYQSASDIAFQLARPALAGAAPRRLPLVGSPGPLRDRGVVPALAAAAVVAAFLLARYTAPAPPPVSYLGLTGQPQEIFNARFAPQSNAVVFSAASEGTEPQIYQLHTDYPLPQPVGPPDTQLLAVSRQDQLAVLTGAHWISHRMFDGTLAVMPLSGGAPRPVLQHVGDADWSPDGSQLAVFTGVGGAVRIEYPIGHVLYHSTAAYLSDLRVAPDGQHLAFFEHPVHADDRGSLDVVALDGRAAVLASGYSSLEGIAWSADSRTIFFGGSGPGDDRNVIRAARVSGGVRVVLANPLDLQPFDADKTGKLLAVSVADTGNLEAKARSWTSERDISWLAISDVPKLSRDGDSVVFSETSEQGGVNYSLLLRNLASPQAVRIGEGIAEDLSPDGAWALAVVPTTPPQMTLYPTGIGSKRVMATPGMESFDDFAAFFPDGRSVMFCGVAPPERDRCYQQAIDSSARRTITPPRTGHGILSPDGTSLLARSDDGRWGVYAVASGALTRPVPGLALLDDNPVQWTADGRAILVLNHSWPPQVEQLDLATGQRQTLHLLAPGDRPGASAVEFAAFSPDLKAYAYSFGSAPSRLVIISGLRP